MADILVIDDTPGVRLVLRDFLERAGHAVREAEDGARGLRLYRDRPADLVVCDLYMPGKKGLETIRELRHLDPAAKVIAMSGGSPVVATDFLPLALRDGVDCDLEVLLDLPLRGGALLAVPAHVERRVGQRHEFHAQRSVLRFRRLERWLGGLLLDGNSDKPESEVEVAEVR